MHKILRKLCEVYDENVRKATLTVEVTNHCIYSTFLV